MPYPLVHQRTPAIQAPKPGVGVHGTTVKNNLDYIQNAGFTAVWISPVNQNYLGPRTAYGDPYHGYWIADNTKLNDRFGTAEDLKALSAGVHRRGMYLMIDIVVNNVMATSTTPDYSVYMFKDKERYHPYCPISWGNRTSEQECWFGDTNVPLPDLNTEDPVVQSTYGNWIRDLVQEYQIDGLRIDAAKHVQASFWGPFCEKAGVFCIGEVDDSDIPYTSQFQDKNTLDSILNYPMYFALREAFAIPGPANIPALYNVHKQMKDSFKDLTVLGNFLENQDNPRWSNISVDPQSLYNAMVWNFMTDGIPIVYYGQEQMFKGNADPWNREPLWTSSYNKDSVGYKFVSGLNQIRNYLVNSTSDWLTSPAQILTTTNHGVAIMKGNVLSVMTNIGSPPANISIATYTPFENPLAMTDVISCRPYVVGSHGTINVDYYKGGKAAIIIPSSLLTNSGICGNHEKEIHSGSQAVQASDSASTRLSSSLGAFKFMLNVVLLSMGLILT